jgi:hypothetical protein
MSNNQQLQALEKQLQALKLRMAGVSYEDIARTVGYKGPSGAYQAVKSAMKKTLREPADELRTLELGRLDEALRAIWPQVKKGNLLAIDRYLKIAERRAKLAGMDAKTEVNLTGKLDLADIDAIRQKRWEQVGGQLSDLVDPE